MDYQKINRFRFLADALHGGGGFAPQVEYDSSGELMRPSKITGPCYIVPHPRESQSKYAARVACAVYENHLRQACERFAAYLSRKSPSRQGVDSDLAAAFLRDADGAGNSLDAVMHSLCVETKARGTMLVLVDLPKYTEAASLAEALSGSRRAIPYLLPIKPETLADYELDDLGRLHSVSVRSTRREGGKALDVVRRWTPTRWAVLQDGVVIDEGEHQFGACPVLALTEDGSPFPHVGKYAQIADLSRLLFNRASELDEILRGQTFSVLTLQVPPEVHNPAQSAQEATAQIGVHSLLVHQGDTPAFIAPDSGPAATYMSRIAAAQSAIDRIGMETASQPGQQQESGLARKMRFEALNADLASFARALQDLESKVWHLFHTELGAANGVKVQYPTDYNLTDTASELDILALLQATGHPDAVLDEKRRSIVQTEFDRADPDTLAALLASIDESAQSRAVHEGAE